jgi:hypothetical protein
MSWKVIRIVVAVMLLAGAGQCQNLQGSDALVFPAHQLTGAPVELTASSAPVYQIDWLGDFPSFQLTLAASALVSSTGKVLPAELLSFTAQGGSFVTLEGDLLEAVQAETLASGSLATPMLILTVPAGLQGRWRYLPRAANFRLSVPAEAFNGTYSGELTATITGEP